MHVTPLRWQENRLLLLDQRLLPNEEIWISCETPDAVAEAIRTMVVRGAPAIGVAAAFGVALAVLRGDDLEAAAARLREARPTAVNLAWAVDRMLSAIANGEDAVAVAVEMERADVEANMQIGRNGAALLGPAPTLLTHCNAGALATAGYGTALGVVRAAVESGRRVAVFADETRPYLQGARLTAWELHKDGIDVTLITDNMAGHFFQKGTFDAVVVGADRIAANGDTANKIGTYTVAVLAAAHGVPFYVAAPVSTIDRHCPSGEQIPIEERSAAEVTEISGSRVAPQGIQVRHPAFDVTPAKLVTAIITERGVLRAPYEEAIRNVFSD